MRIGLFTDTFPPDINGVANSTNILFQELKKAGHNVYVITTYAGIGKPKWDEEHEILRVAGVELPFLYGYVLTSPIHHKAIKEIRNLNLDIIHAQTEFGVGIFARICSKQLNIPLISTYHTTYEDYTHYINFIHAKSVDELAKKGVAKLSKLYGNTSSEVIAPSAKTKELLERYDIKKEITIIPTGLALDKFDPHTHFARDKEEVRKEFHLANEDCVIIYVGRLAKEKSLDLVIQGFHEAKEMGVNIKLLIVGGGPEVDHLVKLNSSFKNDNVIFVGPRPSVEIPDFYHACDAFVSLSLSETQGMTFIEALASGLPVFARKDEVLMDLVEEGKTGWFVDDAHDLAIKLKNFVEMDKEIIEEMRKNCIAQVDGYGSIAFSNRVVKTYKRVIDEYKKQYYLEDVKVHGDDVSLFILRDDEEIEIHVSFEDYLDEHFRKGNLISGEKFNELLRKEKNNALYERCLRKLSSADRTEKEMKDWLKKALNADEDNIHDVLQKLKLQGYIDDERYCSEHILRYKTALKGEHFILQTLIEKGIKEEMIHNMLNLYDDESRNALVYANRLLEKCHRLSVTKAKNKIKERMFHQGYGSDVIQEVLPQLDFSDLLDEEKDNLRIVVDKAKRKYEKKFEGAALKAKVKQYLYIQGYKQEDIIDVLMEVNWDEEN